MFKPGDMKNGVNYFFYLKKMKNQNFDQYFFQQRLPVNYWILTVDAPYNATHFIPDFYQYTQLYSINGTRVENCIDVTRMKLTNFTIEFAIKEFF